MVTFTKPEQPENAPQSISVTESGITIAVMEVHPEKASLPMDVTEAGIVTLINEVQL